jgi:hypothetical protein
MISAEAVLGGGFATSRKAWVGSAYGTDKPRGVAYGDGQFVAVGDAGHI